MFPFPTITLILKGYIKTLTSDFPLKLERFGKLWLTFMYANSQLWWLLLVSIAFLAHLEDSQLSWVFCTVKFKSPVTVMRVGPSVCRNKKESQ